MLARRHDSIAHAAPYALTALAIATALLPFAGCDAINNVSVPYTPPPVCSVASPPQDPGGPPSAASGHKAFAITKLYLGGTTRDGTQDPRAWKYYGLNIDGKTTTKDSMDVCRLAAGASRTTHTNGCSGIDNSFGLSMLPVFEETFGYPPNGFESSLNDSIARGEITNLIVVDQLGAASTQSPLHASLLLAGPRDDDAGTWPVTSDSLVGGDPANARLSFASSFVNDGVLVTWPPSTNGLFAIGRLRTAPTGALVFAVNHVQIVATLSEDGTTLTNGTISGVLPLADVLTSLQHLLGRISDVLCEASAAASIVQQFRQMADILVDGTQDPNRDCDGISFGIGFEAHAVTLGPVVDPEPQPEGCPSDGGADDGVDGG